MSASGPSLFHVRRTDCAIDLSIYSVADIARARERLGSEPQVSFREGIESIVEDPHH